MDWQKVIDRLRWFGKNSRDSATAIIMECGKHDERFAFHKERSDLYFTLAAALEAGLKKKKCKN